MKYSNIRKYFEFQAVVAFAVCATIVAAEAEAEADASLLYGSTYGYGVAPYSAYGYGGYAAPLAYGYGYAPRTYGYGYATAGHYIGKREAEADASLGYGYAPLAYAHNPIWYAPRASSFQQIATPFSVSTVSQIHKREAEADASIAYGYAPIAYAHNPIWWAPRASSFQQISTPYSVSAVHQIHKREAEADASIAYGYSPLAYAGALSYGGVAAHPGFATSYVQRSTQGIHALYQPYGYGLAY